MRIANILFHKKGRKGISSIMGMILGVCMLFSVVVPLFLYVNRVNTVYESALNEMTLFDQERSKESLSVVAYTVENGSELNVYIRNGGPIQVNVTRVWVTDLQTQIVQLYTGLNETETTIPPAEERIIHDIDISSFGDEKLLEVKVATERGNLFSSLTNPLYITPGRFTTLPFNIEIVFDTYGERGWFDRTVVAVYYGSDPSYSWNSTIEVHEHIGGGGGYVYTSVGVPVIGYYNIFIFERDNLLFMDQVQVSYRNPYPWVFVPNS